jgi:hypothetical protein
MALQVWADSNHPLLSQPPFVFVECSTDAYYAPHLKVASTIQELFL